MIRIAVAGAGVWGLNHVRDLASMSGVRLEWVIDPDPERREHACEIAPKVRLAASVEEALADSDLDAVVVASPTPTHAPIARAALAAGKHVLVEKPLAQNGDEAWDLVRRAKRARRLLVVGHLLLYHPAVQRLKGLLRQGRLGKVHYVCAQRTNLGRIRTDEGALSSLAPHDVSVMVHLFGAWPTAVSAQGAAYVQPRWEDVVFLTLRFPGSVLGHVHLSWLDPEKVRRMCLVGSRRMAVFDDMDSSAPLRLHDKSAIPASIETSPPGSLAVRAGEAHAIRVARRKPLREELLAFVRCLRTGSPSLTPGEDGARVVRVLDAAERSLASGGREVRLSIR